MGEPALPPISGCDLRGRKVVGTARAFALLLLGSIAVALCRLIFVYSSDLPQMRALKIFAPTSSHELYAYDEVQRINNRQFRSASPAPNIQKHNKMQDIYNNQTKEKS